MAVPGPVGQGLERRGEVRCGEPRGPMAAYKLHRHGWAGHGLAGQGLARRGAARLGTAGQGAYGHRGT